MADIVDQPHVELQLDGRWHAMSPAEALEALGVSEAGISSAEGAKRLAEHGANAIAKGGGDTPLDILWRQINNPLIYVLLGSGAVAIVMGKGLDGTVVLGVVVANALIGFIQEYRAGRAIEALAAMVPDHSTVIRDGERVTISARDLVPGDVVALASGDKVPADLRLLSLRNLQINEAPLTGESLPVEKVVAALPPESQLADRRNCCYGGTLVTYGTGLALVVATGAGTELGRISAMLKEIGRAHV